MAQPLGTPYSYFTDANGAPLAGGKVYTYTAGTTTPLASYTDSTGTTPAANPVILDSAGRATIWLSGFYKITVKDSADNLIKETDNITALGATGDMNKSIYDAANIQEQLVGLTAVQTMTNKIVGTAASTTSSAGLKLPHGTAPTSPVNGDIWTTTAGVYGQINGTTYRLQERILYSIGGATGGVGVGQCIGTTNARIFVSFKFHLTTAPTGISVANVANFSVYNSTGTGVAASAITFISANLDGIILDVQVASGLTAGNATLLIATNANAEITLTGGAI